jgi:hypothetical protein
MGRLRSHRHWIACALLVPAAAGAHHSRTQYDGSEVQEIQGELTAVSWANPHAAFSVRVTSASGEAATWQLESWGSPYVLSRMGVTQDQFVVGTQVRLAGRASRLVPNRFLLTNMLRPDGTEVVLTTETDKFWDSRQVGGSSQWRNQTISTAAAENRGLFRVWSTARMGQARANRLMLTPRALAARESFDQSKSFVVTCEPQGMPTVMNWVYPFELVQRDASTIILRSEYFDLERTIHVGPGAAAPAPAGSARVFGRAIRGWRALAGRRDDGAQLAVLRHDRYAALARCEDQRAVYAQRRSVGADVSADGDRSGDVHGAGGA